MKKLLLSMAFAVLSAFVMLPHAAQAQATVTCKDFHTLNPSYPTNYPNDGHMFVCYTAAEGSSWYNATRATSIINAGGMVGHADNSLLRNLGTGMLPKDAVRYFYFKVRADAIAYMTANSPWKDTTGAPFANSSSRCGNTGRTNYNGMIGSYSIAVEIYDTCTYNTLGTTQLNPSLFDTTVHESGHAFDLAWSTQSGNPGKPISQSIGYKKQVAGDNTGPNERLDLFVLNLGNANMTAPTTCSVFGTLLPTKLEQDFGSPDKAVCNAQQQQINYSGSTNSTIAGIVAPYFFLSRQSSAAPLYGELFAQEFATLYQDDGTLLPRVNKIISNFPCSVSVVQRLVGFSGTTGDPVDTTPIPCPPATESDYRN